MSRKRSVVWLTIGALAIAGLAFAETPLAEERLFSAGVEFSPKAWGHGFILKVMAPDGSVVRKTVKDGAPSFDLSEMEGEVIDGQYKYELRLIVSPPRDRREAQEAMKAITKPRIKAPSLSGAFLVQGGAVVMPSGLEATASTSGPSATKGGLDAPDAYIAEELCVGYGCTSSESHGPWDELKIKDTSVGVLFEDSSSTGGISTNDWRIRTNNPSGSYSYFAIDDVDGGTSPLFIAGGTPSYTLHLDANGRVGIGETAPDWDLQITSGLQPGLRLNQDSSLGNPLQSWDLVGSDWSFIVGDGSHGKIPFAIEANAPSNGLVLKADGKVGLGTGWPSYAVEVQRTSANSAVVVNRTDGATNYINATTGFGNFGTVTNHPLRLAVNGTWQMRLNNNSSITMANGASLTAGGVWTNASSRMLKQDIKGLSIEEAMAALAGLEPVKFSYKASGERHVGFIAEDVPDLVASADRNGLSPMDLVAVLTRVVQRQKEIIESQQQRLRAQDERDQAQQQRLQQQEAAINLVMARISALESR